MKVYMLASEVSFFDSMGVAILTVSLMLAIAATAVIFGLLDLKRFGRKGAPWSVAISYASLFSTVGTWRYGLVGLLPGLVCILAFARGRSELRRMDLGEEV